MSKPKYCKCGHLLKPNHIKESKFLGMKTGTRSKCNKCDCKVFLRRSYPTISDNVLQWVSVGTLAMVILFGSLAVIALLQIENTLSISDPTHILQHKMLTFGSFLKYLVIAMILGVVYVISILMDLVKQHYRMKDTPVKPIDDSE